ncbi:MAG: hypothetical protein IPM82_02395 [Saprospiraceae bacterium]|nr:hypothetical protein [Saprospiraceae bacterium]
MRQESCAVLYQRQRGGLLGPPYHERAARASTRAPGGDFCKWFPDTVENFSYFNYTYQIIPDGHEEGNYYLLHSFITAEDWEPCSIVAAPKMQISKIDMKANGGLGEVTYKNRYFDEETMGAAFGVVRHGNGRDWWVVRRSPDGLYFRSTLLHRDTAVLTVESTMPGLSADWFDCEDLWASAHNLIHVSPDGDMLLDNYGSGYAKLMAFDRCSGGVSLMDTFSTGTSQLEYMGNELCAACAIDGFAFSPSGRYLYGVGYAEYAQFDLWAPDVTASKVKLGGVPWYMDDFQQVEDGGGGVGGFGTFSLGPDGKLYNLWETMHSVIEHPDEPGDASGFCIAADNAPVSCLGPGVPYYLFSTPHPHYRLGPLTGSGCDTILSSTEPPLTGSGYGVEASPSVASWQVEVGITLPSYGNNTTEIQVVDMLGRVLHRHRFPPYAYLHTLDVRDWAPGLYNLVLLDKGRERASARLVVVR